MTVRQADGEWRSKISLLGNHLTAADNISVSWIFADKRRIIFLGECFRIENALSAAVPCRVFLCVKQSGYNLRYALADRRGTGESRRFAMPEQSTKCGASANSSIMNSWLSSWARFPAKDVLPDGPERKAGASSLPAADMVKSLAGGVGCLPYRRDRLR